MNIQLVHIHFGHWDSDWTLALINIPNGEDGHDIISALIARYQDEGNDMDDDSAVVTYVTKELTAAGILWMYPKIEWIELD